MEALATFVIAQAADSKGLQSIALGVGAGLGTIGPGIGGGLHLRQGDRVGHPPAGDA